YINRLRSNWYHFRSRHVVGYHSCGRRYRSCFMALYQGKKITKIYFYAERSENQGPAAAKATKTRTGTENDSKTGQYTCCQLTEGGKQGSHSFWRRWWNRERYCAALRFRGCRYCNTLSK